MAGAALCAFALFVVAGLMAVSSPARAAESYRNCTGFITSLPAFIDTLGFWCFKQNLSTAMSSCEAVSRAKDNVVKRFASAVSACSNDGNVIKP